MSYASSLTVTMLAFVVSTITPPLLMQPRLMTPIGLTRPSPVISQSVDGQGGSP